MLITALQWLAGWILTYLAKRLEKYATDAAKQLAKDEERDVINADNVAKYTAAAERKERIAAAVALLNGTKS